MSMTKDSSAYFDRVAGEGDSLRAGYFSETVRTAAIRKAYLRPEYHVADAPWGTQYASPTLVPAPVL